MNEVFALIGGQKSAQATEALHQTIKEFNSETKKYSKRMLYLTWVIAILTLILVFGLAIQIWITLR